MCMYVDRYNKGIVLLLCTTGVQIKENHSTHGVDDHGICHIHLHAMGNIMNWPILVGDMARTRNSEFNRV